MAPVLRLGSATPRSQDRTPAPSATVDHSASAAPSAHPARSAIPRERVRSLTRTAHNHETIGRRGRRSSYEGNLDPTADRTATTKASTSAERGRCLGKKKPKGNSIAGRTGRATIPSLDASSKVKGSTTLTPSPRATNWHV